MPDGSKEPKESESGTNAREQNQSAGKDDEYPRSGSGVDFTYNGAQGTSRRRLFRDLDNKTIGGVCAGLAAFLNVDLTIVRIVSLLTLLLWGTGFLVYLVLWIVVPIAKTPAEKCMMHGLEPTAENMARFSQGRSGYGK